MAPGGTYVTASLAERVVQQLSGKVQAPRLAELSDRELDVLKRIVLGQRLTDIAQALHLSIKTVSTHKTRIQEKLQLPSMAALIRYGLEHQLDKDDSGFDALRQRRRDDSGFAGLRPGTEPEDSDFSRLGP